MAEETFVVPDGMISFQTAKGSFKLDPLETIEQCEKIAKDCEGSTELFASEKALAAWIEQRTKTETSPGVKVTPTEASHVWRTVRLEYHRAQKVFTDALDSLTSTASTPSA